MRNLSIMASAAIAVLALGTHGAAAANHHGGERGPGGMHASADANGDGEVSLEEARAQADARFARMDVNQDGQISSEDRAARRADRFAKTDTDGNGELSEAEIAAAREAREAERAKRRAERQAQFFSRADTDGSGGLSQDEMMAARQARGEARQGRRGGRAGMRQGSRQARGMQMLRRADTNQDRIVTKAEFDAVVEARFNRIDADGSGTITAEERKAARDSMRQQRRERRANRMNPAT